MKSIIKILILVFMATSFVTAQIPVNWVQISVEETTTVPVEFCWDLFFQLNLEEIGSVGNYKNLPKIVKTTPVVGNFSMIGESRRVHFDTGETVLESIIDWQKPESFRYELTEIEIKLRKVANRARGQFQFQKLQDNRTKIIWTYAFDQKNFFCKLFIKRYIKTTHQYWMKDTLSETKKQIEIKYKSLN